MTASRPNLDPAVVRMIRLVEGVPDSGLGRPTPCDAYSVGDLLDHIAGVAIAFTGAATKHPVPPPPDATAANLASDWRERIPRDFVVMSEAWRDPAAWTGMTQAGGVDLPAELAAVVALDELVIHGWDLAKATGQTSGYDGPDLDAVHETVQHFRSSGIEGLFGPEVPVPGDAPLLDRILGLTGRDPRWVSPHD